MSDKTNQHENPEVGEDFADIETPEELKPHAAPETVEPVHVDFPPPMDRERPERPPLIPQWVWLAIGLAAAAIVLGVGFAVWANVAQRVAVPDVVGVDEGVARTRLAQAGLEADVLEERFSSAPQGVVLEQRPSAGTELQAGEVVGLIISAGTEEFVMPDVIGDGLALAQGTLESRGLVVEIEAVTSEQASGTVLATTPAPGVLVRIGDTVRVQVASPRPESSNLRPYRLQGLAVTIDPAPSPQEGSDITLDVARRLRALLEASGATVEVLRSGVGTATSDAERAAAAVASTPTVGIGLTVLATGPAGRVVAAPAQAVTPSPITLRDAIASQITTVAPPAAVTTVTSDPVFAGLKAPWARISLGSYSARADETAFADPRWADEVARAIYAGIGEVYGTKEEL